ncbi:hypothetical protein V5O48_012344 [Marasmius crinis-equi]|uniref:F-box domain-containing protein n=1 Tax=Marasmius crinis-equi TaxID=585013 RepID=A0ABR3F305_9AGAR
MTTLDTLSIEILQEIFSSIHDTSRQTIFSLLRVSRNMHEAAIPFVYRDLAFDFNHQINRSAPTTDSTPPPYTRSLERLTWLLNLPPDCVVWKSVKRVAVWSKNDDLSARTNNSEEDLHTKWLPFVNFLSRVVNIREFTFRCSEPVPLILLNILEENHPSCELHVKGWTRASVDLEVGDPSEEALARSPCLRSIEAYMQLNHPGEINLTEAAFRRILALSPNLQAARFGDRSRGFCGNGYQSVPAERWGKIAREEERFKVGDPVRKAAMKTIRWDRAGLDTIQFWETFAVLRNVIELHVEVISDVCWMEYALENESFTGVKRLSLRLAHFPRDESDKARFQSVLGELLDSFSSLEYLRINNFHDYISLPSILSHHGERLRSLTLLQVSGSSRPAPTTTDLDLIRLEAPGLTHLGIDIDLTADPEKSELEIYRIISSFPALRTLAIHYSFPQDPLKYYFGRTERDNGGPWSGHDYMLLNKAFAKKVWAAVHNRRLENLSLHISNWCPDNREEIPIAWNSQKMGDRNTRMYVRRDERDELRGDMEALNYGF